MPFFEFIDTNVFRHFAFFRDIDWAREAGVDAVTLVLAPVVIEELDKRKWSGTRRDKERAKRVLKAIRELGRLDTPVELRNGVFLLALDAEPDDAFLARHRLQRQAQDDRLLASALAFKDAAPTGARVVICTADTGLTLKAPTRQMEAVAPAEKLELPDEPDDTERALETTRRELAAIRSAAPDLRVRFEDGPFLEATIGLVNALDRATVRRILGGFRTAHPIVLGTPDVIEMPGGGVFKMPNFAGVPGFLTREDADAQNKTIDLIYTSHEAYLASWDAIVNGFRRCIELGIVLDNQGAAPADDVDIRLWTDAKGIWREELPDVKGPPVVPRPRSPYELLDHRALMPNVDFPNMRLRDAPIDGPNLSEDGRGEAHYSVKRVKHHVPCVLPKVYFQFDSDADVASFTIHYRLVAANIHRPREGELGVKISVSTDNTPPDPSPVFTDE